MPFPSPTFIDQIWGPIREELLHLYAQVEGYLRREHKADGSHGAVTADSLNGVQVSRGFGSPEGVTTAAVGALYVNRDGGASTTLYVKETGAGATGWRAI